MSFISPMLAATPDESFTINNGEWVAEEKYDGHRLVLQVGDGAMNLDNRLPFDAPPVSPRFVRAWSRHGLSRILPPHIIEAALSLPNGTYDGELFVPGKRSYGVTEIANGPDLVFTVFDVLVLANSRTMALSYRERRLLLETMFNHEVLKDVSGVRLAWSIELESMSHARSLAKLVWERDGEGLILKRKAGTYLEGKRSKDFMKIKALRSAVLEVIGYEAAKMGPHSKVVLRDSEGNVTTVKTRNTAERNRLAADPRAFIGRKLRITFQERTPDGSYRHGRWDRYEDE